jgi:acyl-CoA reductase-like NAD-dependent aldehyde dehydrogenase
MPARVLSGGQQLTDGDMAKGYFVRPTVFADVKDEMRIAREEIFGPVISAIPFTDIDEVIERPNSTHFGLGAGIWTKMSVKPTRSRERSERGRSGSTAIRLLTRQCHLVGTK